VRVNARKKRAEKSPINCLTGGIFFRREKKMAFWREKEGKKRKKKTQNTSPKTNTYTHKSFQIKSLNQYGRILGRTQTQRHLARLVDRAHSRVHVHFRRVSNNTATLEQHTK
jgi:hypothetical protein|tara:strand:- start:261 stop:596 length:336 start_codon:yes stop_codon:yes gene_type:complete